MNYYHGPQRYNFFYAVYMIGDGAGTFTYGSAVIQSPNTFPIAEAIEEIYLDRNLPSRPTILSWQAINAQQALDYLQYVRRLHDQAVEGSSNVVRFPTKFTVVKGDPV